MWLLTSPWTFGYVQNPISVYYVYDAMDGNDDELRSSGAYRLRACAAEVTNTPWGERVVFDFDPSGQRVPKSLHVSPFMDALGDWHVKATDPMACGLFREKSRQEWEHEHEHEGNVHTHAKAKGQLAVRVDVVGHPVFGDYFRASFVGRLDAPRRRRARNERAGLATLWRHACTPHRVAFWIYAQAARVLWAGVPFVPPPGLSAVAEKSRARDAELGDAKRRGRAREANPPTRPPRDRPDRGGGARSG